MKTRNSRFALAVFTSLAAMLACNTSGIATQAPASPPLASTILHQVVPANLPESPSGQASDQNSSVTANKKSSNGGDRFTLEDFERPFNANTMDVYFPNLDIINTSVYRDDTWIYGAIQVVNRSAANTSPYRFAMQFDVNLDGHGEYLVMAENPPSTDWTVSGVQVYFDANGDVGKAGGDGFEELFFDQGQGNDPDAAWVRVSASDPNTVEMAVKRSVLADPVTYMVNMWTGQGTLDASKFDYKDHYTHEQAGAADPGFPLFYPIKAVYALDNSCRIAIGFQPTGSEPGLCPIPHVPGGPGEPGTSCVDYGGTCGGGSACCNGVPCTGGRCRYP